MPRYLLPGIFFLLSAFILSLLVSVSLPSLPTIDITRSHFTSGIAPHVSTNTDSIGQIRVRTSFSLFFVFWFNPYFLHSSVSGEECPSQFHQRS